MKKTFQIFFWFTDWKYISFGIHFDLESPNIEFHIPFGFIKIGWDSPPGVAYNWEQVKHHYFPIIKCQK